MCATLCSRATSRREAPERTAAKSDKARVERALFFMQIELLLVVMLKALAELAFLFLLGRGLLYVLAGRKREGNLFYQVFCIVTNPLLRAARWLTPRMVLDNHIPFVALVLVAWVWLAIVLWALPAMCSSGSYDCSALIERKR